MTVAQRKLQEFDGVEIIFQYSDYGTACPDDSIGVLDH